jgi:hypothetical protein
MTFQENLDDMDVEFCHDTDTVLRTIESSHNDAQLRRFSQRTLAKSAASLPIFERSPAPSPPSSEGRNAFQEEQRTKAGTITPQQCQANENPPPEKA